MDKNGLLDFFFSTNERGMKKKEDNSVDSYEVGTCFSLICNK
jgi:hypothetical protein